MSVILSKDGSHHTVFKAPEEIAAFADKVAAWVEEPSRSEVLPLLKEAEALTMRAEAIIGRAGRKAHIERCRKDLADAIKMDEDAEKVTP